MTEPTKLGFFGPMKTVDSADWGMEELAGGGLHVWIDHEPMPGSPPR